jgi:hypothetical protein
MTDTKITAEQARDPLSLGDAIDARVAQDVAHWKERAEKAEAAAAEMREALESIAIGPDPMDDYLRGIRCGIEDRDLQQYAYAAAEYGYENGVEYSAYVARQVLASIANAGRNK